MKYLTLSKPTSEASLATLDKALDSYFEKQGIAKFNTNVMTGFTKSLREFEDLYKGLAK